MPSQRRFAVASAASVLLLCQPLFAFDSPLSDEAVRQAYFLGQRHDDSLARSLNKYTKTLPPPETGPHIAAVTFLTPSHCSCGHLVSVSTTVPSKPNLTTAIKGKPSKSLSRSALLPPMPPSLSVPPARGRTSRKTSLLVPTTSGKTSMCKPSSTKKKSSPLHWRTQHRLLRRRRLFLHRRHHHAGIPRQRLLFQLSHNPNHPSRRRPRNSSPRPKFLALRQLRVPSRKLLIRAKYLGKSTQFQESGLTPD